MRRRWMALLLVGSLAMARTASADMTLDQKKKQAEALIEEGRTLAKSKDYLGARAKFMQAYAVLPVPNMVYNAARMDHLRGEYAEAYRGYKTYLSLPDSERVSTADRKEAETFSAECDSKICHLEVHGTRTFTVNEKPMSEPLVLGAGTHVVKMDGPKGPKTAEVVCHGGAAILVADYSPKPDVVPTPVPKVTPITPPPQEKMEKGSWLVPGVLAGVGVVGLGVGAGLGLAASGKKSDLETTAATSRPCNATGGGCSSEESTYSSGKTLGIASAVGYGVGGAALVAAVIATLVERPWADRVRVSAHVVPLLGSGTSGLGLVGSF